MNYNFPGNVRQLKNLVEQISIIEQERDITLDVLKKYIPEEAITTSLSTLKNIDRTSDMFFERELVFKFLSEMHKDMNQIGSRF